MKKTVKLAAIILALAILCSCSGGRKAASKRHTLSADFSPVTYTFTASPLPSEDLTLSVKGLTEITDLIADRKVDYSYSDMYDLDEVKKRLDFDATVTKHKTSALDGSGRLN